ncbi:hypothetical protein NEUTE1DRAFT_106472 [Neurospora tetrasperma FGSC 2508]|uniref:Uncharacterized protein n=1 Tax=Neurospora tetrasperma (strain FGSC 2508 / ATCC MYA-4615 / P0657) TaxID=510951 RepID=F8N4N3_NEUT8|nr:uncharacterized protein NEUTE1DRAFT_106472 [Neurospora tetrasperma FGSC 2508]EGO53571.1 hypothetical protein NEUTE1DRAFT_106472 [Neurospora tetrasperma FGSC 2508]
MTGSKSCHRQERRQSSVIVTGDVPYNPITYMICVLVRPQSTTDDVVLSRVPGLPPLFEQHHERCYHDNLSGRLSHDVRTSAAYQAESVLAQVDGPSLAEGSLAQTLTSQKKHDVMLSCA